MTSVEVFGEMITSILNSDDTLLDELLTTHETEVLEYLHKCVWNVEMDDRFKAMEGQTLLHIAADHSRCKCVRVILSHTESYDRTGLCNRKEESIKARIPLHTVLDGGCRCENCAEKNIDCVTVLLEAGSDIDARDGNGRTPLECATEFMMADCASLLLEHGAKANIPMSSSAFSGRERKHIVLYEYIAQRIPEALTALLDRGITPDPADSSTLHLEFKLFLQAEEDVDLEGRKATHSPRRETDILLCMANAHAAGRELLLKHPMTLAFLHFKWSLVRPFTTSILAFYFAMTVIYTFFVFGAFDEVIQDDINSDSTTTTPVPIATDEEEDDAPKILVYFVCIWWLFMLLNEIYEISQGLSVYLRVGLNYAWWVLIIAVGITIPAGFSVKVDLWQLPVAAFAVFLTWGLTLVQISRIPSLGIYIEMLGKVVRDFAVFVITFAALLVGFAMAFHVLFQEARMFTNVGTAFMKVLLMMIGETDYETTFERVAEEDREVLPLEYTISAHIMFAGFIFVVTIVLMNLLLGLAVSDIQELRNSAEGTQAKRQIEQIKLFESLILSQFVPKGISIRLMNYFSIAKIMANYPLESDTAIAISPTDPADRTLPKYLKEAFITHVFESPCINPEPLIGTSGPATTEPGPGAVLPTSERDRAGIGRKRLARLEKNITQIEETLRKIQERLFEQK